MPALPPWLDQLVDLEIVDRDLFPIGGTDREKLHRANESVRARE